MLPERIGRYEVVDLAGSGGFATVYECFDPRLDAGVAIKVLADNWSRDPEVVRRFRREAVLMRRLRTEQGVPGLVEIFDIDQTDSGQPFFVMGWANRGTLKQRAGKRAWDFEHVWPIVQALTQSLGHLHARGVIHRDIKPANLLLRSDTAGDAPLGVLVGPDERLLVGDLGLAKDITDEASSLSLVAGTERYMAPEQLIMGGSIDHRADIFSATAMVSELLGGRDRNVPSRFESTIAQGLANDRDQRFASMSEWQTAFALAAEQPDEDMTFLGTAELDATKPLVVAHVPVAAPLPDATPVVAAEAPASSAAAKPPLAKPSSVRTKLGIAVALAFVVALGALLALRGSSGPSIVGPDVITSGETATYVIDSAVDGSVIWTDPSGAKVNSPSLVVTGRLPGRLVVSVEVQGESTSQMIDVLAAPNGPEIRGPAELSQGSSGIFTARVPDGHSFYWIHPTRGQVFDQELTIVQAGDSFIVGLISVDQQGIERGDQRLVTTG